MNPGYWRDLCAAAYGGRRWILATEHAAGVRHLAATLRELGAGPLLVLAGEAGAGEETDEETVVLGAGGSGGFMGALRAFFRAVADVPAAVQQQVDAWDPAREARVISSFTPAEMEIAGRPSFGSRPRAWEALEDKISAVRLWRDVGLAHAPSAIVPVASGELPEAARRIDEGMGTVWVADNRDGWHGGGEFARWVRTDAQAEAAVEFFAGCSDVVRVMPFLDGIPCSIHAVVFPGYVAAFRPAEMITLRRPGRDRFAYAGVATFWDAPDAAAAEMRDAVLAVAAHLGETVGYRGAFGLDGVLTRNGFFPTELNARFSPGLMWQADAVDGLPMQLVDKLLVAGHEADYRAVELEDLILTASRERRNGHFVLAVPGATPAGTREQRIRFVGGEAEPAAADDPADAELSYGPRAGGGVMRCHFEPGAMPIGPPVAPLAVAACRLAAEVWGLDVGELEAAPDVWSGQSP